MGGRVDAVLPWDSNPSILRPDHLVRLKELYDSASDRVHYQSCRRLRLAQVAVSLYGPDHGTGLRVRLGEHRAAVH